MNRKKEFQSVKCLLTLNVNSSLKHEKDIKLLGLDAVAPSEKKILNERQKI